MKTAEIRNKFLKYFLDELIELMNLQERDQLISYLNNSVHWRRALSVSYTHLTLPTNREV